MKKRESADKPAQNDEAINQEFDKKDNENPTIFKTQFFCKIGAFLRKIGFSSFHLIFIWSWQKLFLILPFNFW